MFAIIGLGNPGEEYAHTRHNAGFETVDLLAEELGVTYWKQPVVLLWARVKSPLTVCAWRFCL